MEMPAPVVVHRPDMGVEKECRPEYQNYNEEHEECCQSANCLGNGAQKECRQSIDNCQKTKTGVENTYPCEIESRSEVADSLFLRWIVDVDGDGMNGYSVP